MSFIFGQRQFHKDMTHPQVTMTENIAQLHRAHPSVPHPKPNILQHLLFIHTSGNSSKKQQPHLLQTSLNLYAHTYICNSLSTLLYKSERSWKVLGISSCLVCALKTGISGMMHLISCSDILAICCRL